MSHKPFAFLVALTAIACFMVINGRDAEAAIRTFVIEQQGPSLDPVDLRVRGHSNGDMLAFEADITADDGTAGTLRGILITVDLPDAEGDPFEDRIGQLVFDLGAGNSLVVVGASVYAEATTEMNTNGPQLRAVVGGTGKFLGARGQATTTRRPDGTYEHRFEFLD